MILFIIDMVLKGFTVEQMCRTLAVSEEWLVKVQGTDGYKAQLALARGEVPPDSYVGR